MTTSNLPAQTRRTPIFDQVRFNRDDFMYHALFWAVLYALHYINFAYTDAGVNHTDAFITANLTIITTSIAAYVHTYWLLPRSLGNPKINSIIGLAVYFVFTITLVLLSSALFEVLYKTGWFGVSKRNMDWLRDLPESFLICICSQVWFISASGFLIAKK